MNKKLITNIDPNENNFLDVTRVQYIKYIENEMIPLLKGNKMVSTEIRKLDKPIDVGIYTIYDEAINTLWIKNYFEILSFRHNDNVFSLGLNNLLAETLWNVIYKDGTTGKEKTNHETIELDVFMYRKNIDHKYPKFWDTFHFKDIEYEKITKDKEYQKQFNTINFNHLSSAILDFYNINGKSDVTAENIGINRTKNKFKESVVAKESQLNNLYEILAKHCKDPNVVKLPNLILLGDSEANQIHELYEQEKKKSGSK